MIDREKIETLLKIQGISTTASDEQIRSVLLSAQYHDDEISTAINELRENKTENRSRIDGLHTVFRTDKGLKPVQITALLGIDVNIDDIEMKNHRQQGVSRFHYLIILLLTIFLSIGGLTFAMYLNQSGPFHPSIYVGK